jgi:hypothetical protein
MQAMQDSRRKLVEAWNPYIKAVDTYLKEKENRTMNDIEKQNVATCLENAMLESAGKSKLFETTYAENISFLGVQLPVIAALLPSLVLNKIAIVQALDRRTGAVFYLDVKYGQSKGAVGIGQSMMAAKTGHNATLAGRRYASVIVEAEVVTGGSFTLAYKPIVPGTLIITANAGGEILTDDGAGNLVSNVSGGSGAITSYTNGTVTVTYGGGGTGGAASYRYNYEKATDGVPSVDITLTNEPISAIDFPLRANYTLGAAIDLEKAHGMNLEDELVKYLGGEIKFEIDHLGIDYIKDAAESALAADPIGTWSASIAGTQEWVWKKYHFIDYIEKGSNNIFSKTLRAMANFIICGNTAARVIRQLEPHFKPIAGLENISPTGPIELGTLDGRIVIQDPFLDPNKYYLGYKGDSFLMAGFIYAPYIPLFATTTLITADLKAQKGFLSAAGFKVINPGMYTYGVISGI